VDEARKLQRRVIIAVRARRAFLLACLGAFLVLGSFILCRFFGFSFPVQAFFLVAFFAGVGFAWPARVRWLRVGKRLGLGGKLPGLVAALKTQSPTFVSLLLPQIRFRPWRLFFPEVLAALPVIALTGLLFFPHTPKELSFPPSPPPPFSEVENSAFSSFEPGQEGLNRPAPKIIPQLPPDFSSPRSLYEELLAQLLGEQVKPEEVWERLAKEEGILRQLAELLSKASAQEGGLGEMEAEYERLVSELSRPDLREALRAEKEDLGKVREAVAAALESLSTLKEGSSMPSETQPEGGGSQQAFSSEEAEDSAPKDAQHPTEILMDTEAEELRWGKFAEAEEGGLGLGAGWERGEPVQLGTPAAPPEVEELVPVAVRSGEGPVRQGFALAIPGETPGTAPEGTEVILPEQGELLLRAKDLPPGLRELVRRYFQLLTEGGQP